MTVFEYSNLPDRPSSALVRVASQLLRGVRDVQAQVHPYARAWQESNLRALAERGPLWVALGDSMTQGIGASDFDKGWVGQLAERLAAAGRPYRVVNLASSGARVQDLIDRQIPALHRLGTTPDLVTVLIGSNDILSRRQRTALPDRAAELIRQLPKSTVMATLPNPTRTATEVNTLIEQARNAGALVVAELRQRRTMNWKGRLAADHFHPNDLGYSGITSVFADAILGPAADHPGNSAEDSGEQRAG